MPPSPLLVSPCPPPVSPAFPLRALLFPPECSSVSEEFQAERSLHLRGQRAARCADGTGLGQGLVGPEESGGKGGPEGSREREWEGLGVQEEKVGWMPSGGSSLGPNTLVADRPALGRQPPRPAPQDACLHVRSFREWGGSSRHSRTHRGPHSAQYPLTRPQPHLGGPAGGCGQAGYLPLL